MVIPPRVSIRRNVDASPVPAVGHRPRREGEGVWCGRMGRDRIPVVTGQHKMKPKTSHSDLPGGPRKTGLQEVIDLILDHESAFRAFLLKRLGDKSISDDLFQQCLLRAVEHQHSIEHHESVVPWFYRVLRNAVIDYYRSKAVQFSRQETFERDAHALGDVDVPSLDEVRPTVCACLERVLTTLRPSYAELIQRIDLRGESTADVATALHISSSNALVRLHRARKAVRNGLEATCGVCTKHGCLNCTCS